MPTPTGYFGALTKAAVVAWQEANAVINPGTGYFGALSRAKLSQISGCTTGNNLPPVISGVAGPTNLQIGQTGTWVIQASDPENDVLGYYARWGDELVYGLGTSGQATPAPTILQNSTLSHTYQTAGVYRPDFFVTDRAGHSVSTSITVTVGPASQSSITVISPNGGEQWVAGSVQDIKWTNTPASTCPTCNLSADWDKVDLYLNQYVGCDDLHPICPAIALRSITLDKNIRGDRSGVYHWIVASEINSSNITIPAGQYLVRICAAGSTTNCDSSAQSFSILAGQISTGGNY